MARLFLQCLQYGSTGALKFAPAYTAASPSSSSILSSCGHHIQTLAQNMEYNTYKPTHHQRGTAIWRLHTWLYLARRSDRQGAPVLIWPCNKRMQGHH
jgi:hypothetical protein